MITYLNTNDKPIIRRCANCIHFQIFDEAQMVGYCKATTVMFAFTMEKNVSLISKPFYLCEKHELKNEAHLKATATAVSLKDALKPKDKI
jgi:hypothetical protein